jgi:deoxyribose-phosphate aldolase
MQNFNKYDLTFDDLDARIKEILPEPLTVSEKLAIGKTILNCIDLTTLSGTDNRKKVEELSKQAISYKRDDLGIENTAAVCVYPVFAGTVSSVLSGSGVKTASVAGAFPSGQSPLEIRIKEVEYALENGAEEIDMVISRGRLLEGDEDFVFEEVSAIKEVCGNAHLKVILETGELKTVNLIRRASEIAILAGADFLKTSTGKIQPAATPGALLIMLDTIKEYYNKTGRKIGVKPAGGISEPDDAIKYYLLTQAVLGNEWMNNSLFRIGASRLADKMYDFIIDNSTF